MHTLELGVCAVTLVLTMVASGQQPVGDSNSPKASSGPAVTQFQPGSSRAITFRVAPEYPRLATSMNLMGTVQLQAVVRADGTVKRVRVMGGHPVLAEAAAAVIMRWRYEVGPRETTESVKISFGK
jgi:TonB family protein